MDISLDDGTTIKQHYLESWEIKDGKLILTPMKKYEIKQLNTVIVDTIQSIDDKQMILINPQGKKLIRNRIN